MKTSNQSRKSARRSRHARRAAALDRIENYLKWYEDHGTPEAQMRRIKRIFGML